ncbi:retinitis pigmentosa 1-like 1 protein [Scleropages formosus]|uniref:Rp1 like 1a n=1 Tax=Scleropages formosus TaxID=113540 RepID=A0A8C9S3H4_SCLFO|nr:retinitis pigmentosa 1-like 1 protein [Scleropages formosus]
MHTAQAGNPDPIAHFKNDTSQHTRSSSDVTGAVPAKRVTFFKSGDDQFGGVRMAIHKRSFKSFDALLDDLSQRVPLPFGVRTITTPRGIHSISHLEQLEDGGCYLCSDRRHVKPINIEAAGKRPTVWHHRHLHNIRRKPSRPEEAPTAHSSHRYPRHPKRIVLVKNNDPAVRRSIILSRRTARSLRVFMEEVSELMQCHIRKLYTLEGRKIDSIQSLMQCPNVLVCVGREPFRPLQVESMRNGSDEKLPGLTSRSRSSVCSESHDSKKNVNFGLETKKSIIHPRSDSSNRSTRFSLSSEKSYANGLNVTPGNTGCFGTCPHAKENLMNDDIEKRVLVNKDGSLSVEMKVRFRLLNDETLQWSTEIRKSIGTVNDSSLGKEDTRYLQHVKSESVSDPEFNAPCDTDAAFKNKQQPRHFEETHCHCCCNHCHEYDIWKNPLHGDSGPVRNINSSSSSASSQKIVCKKASVDSMHTMSQSSEEYTERVVQKATCYQQTVEGGDTRVEYCTISRCCSRGEICASSAKCGSRASTEEKCESPENVETRSNSVASLASRCSQKDQVSVKITQVSEERPVSAISNSSKVLEALREDDDDDDDDLPPSVSRASLWSQSDNPEDCECARSVASCCSATTHKSVSSINHLCPRPPSKTSVHATLSAKLKHKSKSSSPTPEVLADQDEGLGTKNSERADSAASAVSNDSSRSRNYYKPQDGVLDTVSVVSGNLKEGAEENGSRAASTLSQSSKASRLSNQFPNTESLTAKPGSVNSHLPPGQDTGGTNIQDVEDRVNSTMFTATENSGSPGKSNVCPRCGGSDRATRLRSRESQNPSDLPEAGSRSIVKSDKSNCSTPKLQLEEEEADEMEDSLMSASPVSVKSENINGQDDGDVAEERKEIASSGITNTSTPSEESYTSENVNEANEKPEKRSASALSAKSNASTQSKKSRKSENKHSENEQEVVETEQRTPSAMSSKTNVSTKSRKSNCNASVRGISPKSDKSDGLTDKKVNGEDEDIEKRASSAMSARTNTSSKSQMSKKCNVSEKTNSPVSVASDNVCEEETEAIREEMAERALSATSAKTSASAKSRTSKKSNCSSSEKAVNTRVTEERVNSAMSQSSITSERSRSSNKPECTAIPGSSVLEVPTSPENAATVDDGEERAPSNLSVSTKTSRKSKLSKDNVYGTSDRASTPGTPLPPKICGGDDHTETEESEGRVSSSLSGNSKVSRRSRKSHKCINQAVERATSPASDRSTQSLKTRRNAGVDCSPSDRPPTLASATNGADERIAHAASQSTKSKSVRSNKSVLTTPNSLTPEPADGKEMEQCAEDTEESPKSILPLRSKTSEKCKNSDRYSSKQVISPSLNASEAIFDNEAEVASVKSSCTKRSKKNKNCSESSSRGLQSTSTGFSDSEEQCISKSDTVIKKVKALESDNKKPSSNHSKSPSQYSKSKTTAGDAISFSTSRPVSSASARSTLGRSKARDNTDTDMEGRPKSNASRVSSSLQVKGDKINSESEDDHEGAVNTSMKASKKGAEMKEQRPNSDATSDFSQNVLNPSPPKEMPKKNKRPVVHLGNSHDSDLSHSLSAADLLRERLNKVKPETGEYKRNISSQTRNVVLDTHKAVSDEKSDSGTKCRHRKSSSSSWHRREDEEMLEIVPSSLPNTSPTEVVHEWLKKIPADSPMYEMGEDLDEHPDGPEIQKDVSEKVEEPFQEESVKLVDGVVEPDTVNEEENEDKEGQNEKSCFEQPAETKQPTPEKTTKCPSRDALPRSCQSSVQVMKVLLSPKFDRCNSLPEVSPVYGRKLSTSAKGLLDCLANLQLIDSDPSSVTARDARYNELMNILQSLWLCDPSESSQSNKFKTHRSVEDPKSSSGVDVSSGSAGSGKSSDNGGVDQTKKIKLVQTTVTPLADQDVQHLFQNETEQNGDKENCSSSSPKLILNGEEHPVLSETATPDIASRVQGSPLSEEIGNEEEKQKGEEGPDSNETVRSDGSLKEMTETPSSSNKSSGNGSNTLKSPDETETDLQEDASSRTHQTEEKIKLTRKTSQDPDPVWVLNLLKKLEKQFMTHYVNAMTEFKMRWDLDDSEMLDTMINELRDEVRKRIQSSINRELQKIRSRAGKEPRPPIKALSRESTVQTEQRRRRLKVMRNKSIKESLQRSDENYTATGTDFSDQRSEDEYCPCDACMKKKMASRLVERKTLVTAAPVMTDFDLRKILQMKKDPATTAKTETTTEVEHTTAEVEGDQDKNEYFKVLEEEAQDEGNVEEKGNPVAPKEESFEAEEQADREEDDDQNPESEKAEVDYALDAVVEDVSTEQLEGSQECFSEKVEDTAGEDVEETAGPVKESEALDVVEEGESGTENEVGSSEEIPEENARDTEAVREDDAEGIEEIEAIQENDEGNGAEINDALVDNDAPEEVTEENADNDNDQSDKDELAEVTEAACESERDQTADDDAVEEGSVTEDLETTEEAEGDKDNADGKEKAEESDSARQDEKLGDEIPEEVSSEACETTGDAESEDGAKSLEGSNVEEEAEKENGKPHEEKTTFNPSCKLSQEEQEDGSDKAEGEGEQDDVEEIAAVTENDTDTAVEEDANNGGLDENTDTGKEQETENSDKDAKEDAAETNVEDSGASGVEKQHESDVSGDSIEVTEVDKQDVVKPMSTAGSTEDKSEICGVEALTTEKDQIGSDELEDLEDEEWRTKPIKQITKSSIESQPGSMETALDQEKKLKDTESPHEGSFSPTQEEETDSLSLPPKASKHNILSTSGTAEKPAIISKKKPSAKIIKSRRHKDSGLK